MDSRARAIGEIIDALADLLCEYATTELEFDSGDAFNDAVTFVEDEVETRLDALAGGE